jgi:hypothetical protein
MAAVAPPGALERARVALRGDDFRTLFAIRIVGQGGDGFFTVALFASVVFNPSEHSTTFGLFKAALITALPFTLLGPFVGVFIDRWRRRRILAYAPLLKVALVGSVLFDPTAHAIPFYVGALAVISINRFYLATASAVVPRLVPSDDLLIANSLATVGGTLALWWASSSAGSSRTPAGRARSSRSPPSRGSVPPCWRSGSGPIWPR